jgi:hypothetical protein
MASALGRGKPFHVGDHMESNTNDTFGTQNSGSSTGGGYGASTGSQAGSPGSTSSVSNGSMPPMRRAASPTRPAPPPATLARSCPTSAPRCATARARSRRRSPMRSSQAPSVCASRARVVDRWPERLQPVPAPGWSPKPRSSAPRPTSSPAACRRGLAAGRGPRRPQGRRGEAGEGPSGPHPRRRGGPRLPARQGLPQVMEG